MQYRNVPQELRALKAWLVWKKVEQPGDKKPRRIPHYVTGEMRHLGHGSAEDREKLGTFEEAVALVEAGKFNGITLATLMDNNIVALDFDDVVKDGVILPAVEKLVSGTYAEFSPSGNGIRAFFRGHLGDRKELDHGAEFKFEVFHARGAVTVTGNVTPMTEMFGCEIQDLTAAVEAEYERRFKRAGLSTATKVGLSIAKAEEIVCLIDSDCGYDTWLGVGQALHFEFDGSDEAFDLWDKWSASAPSYPGTKKLAEKWKSLGNYSGDPRTAAWILKITKDKRKELDTEQRYNAVAEFKKRIASAADEFTLRERLCPEIASNTKLDELDRESLALALLEKFKGFGLKYPIAQCRKLVELRKRFTVNAQAKGETSLPAWAKDWVFVTDEDKFFRIDSDEWMSMMGFNARFNRELPPDDDQAPNAGWVALNDLGMPVVTRGIYLPWAPAIFDFEGVKCVNKYRPSSVPKEADSISREGEEAIETVKKHIDFVCGGRAEVADTLIAWLAHNVQKPGVKIRWAPLIKGIEGDGKSLFASLLSATMGRVNVRVVSPKVLQTDFNGWAEGACVACLEEIRLTGHSRHDVLNSLKPVITNDVVPVHRKGVDEYDAVNTQNYLAFTNHSDALPIGDTDRRWWVIFTPVHSPENLREKLGGDTRAYFDRLHSAIERFGPELRRWLLDHQIPASFNPNGPAPMTDEKKQMVALSVSPEEEAVREVLDQGALGVGRSVLSSSCLSAAVTAMDPDLRLETSHLNRLLNKLGWIKEPKKLKWRAAAHTIWTLDRVARDSDQVRVELDLTVPGSKLADLF